MSHSEHVYTAGEADGVLQNYDNLKQTDVISANNLHQIHEKDLQTSKCILLTQSSDVELKISVPEATVSFEQEDVANDEDERQNDSDSGSCRDILVETQTQMENFIEYNSASSIGCKSDEHITTEIRVEHIKETDSDGDIEIKNQFDMEAGTMTSEVSDSGSDFVMYTQNNNLLSEHALDNNIETLHTEKEELMTENDELTHEIEQRLENQIDESDSQLHQDSLNVPDEVDSDDFGDFVTAAAEQDEQFEASFLSENIDIKENTKQTVPHLMSGSFTDALELQSKLEDLHTSINQQCKDHSDLVFENILKSTGRELSSSFIHKPTDTNILLEIDVRKPSRWPCIQSNSNDLKEGKSLWKNLFTSIIAMANAQSNSIKQPLYVSFCKEDNIADWTEKSDTLLNLPFYTSNSSKFPIIADSLDIVEACVAENVQYWSLNVSKHINLRQPFSSTHDKASTNIKVSSLNMANNTVDKKEMISQKSKRKVKKNSIDKKALPLSKNNISNDLPPEVAAWLDSLPDVNFIG